MKKSTQPEPLALEALSGLLGDAGAKVLYGSKALPGIFTGSTAAIKTAGQFCLEQGWLEGTGDFIGKGKTRKEMFRLTAAGLQAVLTGTSPVELLQQLQHRLECLVGTAESLPSLVQEKFAEVTAQVASFNDAVQKTTADLRQTMAQAQERLKPPSLEELQRLLLASSAQPSQPAAAISSAPTGTDWRDEVVRLAGEQKQRNSFQRLTIPQIFEHLHGKYPKLTLGEYHDGLRRLHDDKRIRLGAYTQALATLDDPRNALFLDREVKYYVELA